MNSKPPTIATIAQVAEVHTSTVSRALRNDPQIPDSTCRRIQKIAKDLGYQRNALVSALMTQIASHRTPTYQANIAYLNTYYTPTSWKHSDVGRQFFHGIQERAEQFGYHVDHLWVGDLELKTSRLHNLIISRGISGVLIQQSPRFKQVLNHFDFSKFACVLIGAYSPSANLNFVCNDHFATGRLAHENLFSLGYRRVGLVLHQETNQRTEQRYVAGFQSLPFCSKKTASIPPLLVAKEDENPFLKWFHRYSPDAILADTIDSLPLDKWTKKLGLKIPKQLGLAYLYWQKDDQKASGISQNSKLVAAAAVDLLIEQINRNEKGIYSFPKGVLIEGKWVEGKTTRKQ